MKTEIKISEEITEPYAAVYTNKITDTITKVVSVLDADNELITAYNNDKTIFLKPKEIYLFHTENDRLIMEDEKNKYASPKRLYELEYLLGAYFNARHYFYFLFVL